MTQTSKKGGFSSRWTLTALGLMLLPVLIVQPLVAETASVDPKLLEALETQERVGARVFFTVPDAPDFAATQSFAIENVDPVVLDLAQALLPGELGLVQYEWIRALRGVVDEPVVAQLQEHPQVLSIELDESISVAEPDVLDNAGSCTATSNRACVLGNRFSLQVAKSGGFQPVATSGSLSAVFHFGNSANWEVLAKVLNGCAINNHYWVFGAGATGQAYSLHVVDTMTGTSISYNGAALCPIADTSFFSC